MPRMRKTRACRFFTAAMIGRDGAPRRCTRLMDRACALLNDVGLLSEEYDPRAARQVGNFPQALSHLALVGAADALDRAGAA
ncbi:glycoside hydrolase family 15 protein [Microbacterium paulum]